MVVGCSFPLFVVNIPLISLPHNDITGLNNESINGSDSIFGYPSFQNQTMPSLNSVSQNGHNQIQTPTHFNTCINNQSHDDQSRSIPREKDYVHSRLRFSCLQRHNDYQRHSGNGLEPDYEKHSKGGRFLFHSDTFSEFIQIPSQQVYIQDTKTSETNKDDHSMYSRFLQKQDYYCNFLRSVTNKIAMNSSSSDREKHCRDSFIDSSLV